MLRRLFVVFCCTAIGLGALTCCVQPNMDAAQKQKKGKLVRLTGNLDNPCGIAVQPGTDHVFVAAHNGVFRIDPQGEKKKKRKLIIKGYPTDIYGKGPKYEIGPLGLAFLDKNHLVVGDGSRPDGAELVRIYEVGDTLPKKAVDESKAEITLGPITMSTKTAKGEGNFYGVAVGAGSIFISCNGDDTKGWVAQSVIKNGKPGKLTLSIATKVATNVDAPVPLTISPEKELVVGQMGEITVPKDSLLTFYDPATGELKRKMKTGLFDITGLAYSTKTGKLYATDFAWMDTKKKGGLYRLDVKGDSCKATKIRRLDKPTALAFDSKGRCYVTIIGTAKEGAKRKPGAVVVFDGL